MLIVYCFSMALGPRTMRNAVLGFAQCVRPGGKPTHTHCLSMYSLPGPLTGLIWFGAVLVLLPLGPITCFVRLFYPEHALGVNSGRFLRLYWLFLRHPLAVQGEGPSNGDGLSSLCSSESLIYPITERELTPGPPEEDYWLKPPSEGGEGKPRLRDMFHDKVFCHRFFRSHGVACPILVAEVDGQRLSRLHVDLEDAPAKLIWKPRYSTMGLGVEHFVDWGPEEFDEASPPEWAPSGDPYIIEELIQSTEYDHSEWYRCTTLWAHDQDSPMPGCVCGGTPTCSSEAFAVREQLSQITLVSADRVLAPHRCQTSGACATRRVTCEFRPTSWEGPTASPPNTSHLSDRRRAATHTTRARARSAASTRRYTRR